jgi:hypothetical protein
MNWGDWQPCSNVTTLWKVHYEDSCSRAWLDYEISNVTVDYGTDMGCRLEANVHEPMPARVRDPRKPWLARRASKTSGKLIDHSYPRTGCWRIPLTIFNKIKSRE